MDWKTKCRLIKPDSPTVVRYFEHRFLQLFYLFVKSPHNPILQVTDYFMRIEFAGWGTIHIHWFAYLKMPHNMDVKTMKLWQTTMIKLYLVPQMFHQNLNSTLNIRFTDIQRPVKLEILIDVGSLFLFHQCKRLSYWNQLNMNQNKKRLT